MVIEVMRFHGPGWTLDLSERDEYGDVETAGASYMVWGPQAGELLRDEERFPGMWSTDGMGWHPDAREPRQHWAASWQSADGDDGDFVTGASAGVVLAIFPPDVRDAFTAALEGTS